VKFIKPESQHVCDVSQQKLPFNSKGCDHPWHGSSGCSLYFECMKG
jgi:hypothetical protein